MADEVSSGLSFRQGILLADGLPGQPVAISPLTTNTPLLIPMDNSLTAAYGVIAFNHMPKPLTTGNTVDFAIFGAVIWEVAGDYIEAGWNVQWDGADNTVIPLLQNNIPIGFSLETKNPGEMIRIQLLCPLNLAGGQPQPQPAIDQILMHVEADDWVQEDPDDPYTISISTVGHTLGSHFMASFVDDEGDYRMLDYHYDDGESEIIVSSNQPHAGDIYLIG
jgi:hypothetical protein